MSRGAYGKDGRFEARRAAAIKALYSKQEAVRKEIEKAIEKEKKKRHKERKKFSEDEQSASWMMREM